MRQAQTEISGAEYAEWLAYFEVEPFGEERADLRTGIAAARLAASWAGGDHRPADFMPRFDEPREQQQKIEDMQARLMAAFGKRG